MAIRYQRIMPAQAFALAFGVVYLAVGLIGFGATGFDGWFSQDVQEKLLLFPLNGIHNIVHIAVGVIWMVSSNTHERAKRTNLVLGVVLIALAGLGFAGLAKWAAIEGSGSADNYLHVVTGLLSLYLGTNDAAERFVR
jgi:hypothetical protein